MQASNQNPTETRKGKRAEAQDFRYRQRINPLVRYVLQIKKYRQMVDRVQWKMAMRICRGCKTLAADTVRVYKNNRKTIKRKKNRKKKWQE